MQRSNIRRLFRTTKEANAILMKASGVMLKTSLLTTKEIASLYKNAGFKAFRVGKDILKKTVELTINNQKEILKTSGEALKEVTQSIREQESEHRATGKSRAKTAGRPKKQTQKKKEVTIDDLID